MLSIRLLTVEDENPEVIYSEIHGALSTWLFIRKGLVALEQAGSGEQPWVTNLADWRSVIERLAARHDLTFCTVDLRIPETAQDSTPDLRHGLSLVQEILGRPESGLRCCVLTGLDGSELESLQQRGSFPEILFDFKGDRRKGYPNIVNYIRSQALSLIHELRFPASDGKQRLVVLDEETGTLRDHYLSKASYFIDPARWHFPILLIGEDGLGARTFLEFVSYLADTDFVSLDLRAKTSKQNRETLRALQTLVSQVADSRPLGGRRQLIYVKGLDEYQPGISAEEGESCLPVLKRLLDSMREVKPDKPCPVTVAFSVSGENRLRIRSGEARTFLRLLEDHIGEVTGFPLEHLGIDENGWTTGHPRILHVPSLKARGADFMKRTVETQLALLRESVNGDLLEDAGGRLSLTDDVFDLVVDKVDWSTHANLAGLHRLLSDAFGNFLRDRAAEQWEITRSHLDDQAKEWLRRAVLSMDDVHLEFRTGRVGRLLVVERADFQVEEGELLVILGPSGSGKSTILRMFAGLLEPTSGKVSYRGTAIKGPSERVGMVFQDYSLFPWLTVRENVFFGPKSRGERPETYTSRAERLLEVARLTDFEEAYPGQLSGGMRQRVAIIRALANDPDVLLMDEPFGALDLQTRWQMQEFLLETKRITQKTIVFVTHDIDEAVFVGDRIYIASPRPLSLGKCFEVPFSPASRTLELRRDPTFVTLVNRVRDALLAAASKAP
jgi:NitT/TauT family transport system ATP-binding protein